MFEKLFSRKSSAMERLYALEINFGVSCFWDGGFDVWLGDELNGILAEDNLRDWRDVEPWFLEMAVKHFPGCANALKEGMAKEPAA